MKFLTVDESHEAKNNFKYQNQQMSHSNTLSYSWAATNEKQEFVLAKPSSGQ